MQAIFGLSCIWCLSVLVNLGELLLRLSQTQLSWQLSAPCFLLPMCSFGGFIGFGVMLDEGFFYFSGRVLVGWFVFLLGLFFFSLFSVSFPLLAGCTASPRRLPEQPSVWIWKSPWHFHTSFQHTLEMLCSPLIYITYHPKAPRCCHGVVFHGLSESQIPGLVNPVWNLRSGGTLEMRWLNPPFHTPNGMFRNSLLFLMCLWRYYWQQQ